MDLALFDFDGTITKKEMFTDFIHFSTSKKRVFFARIILFPWILLYKLGWYPAYKLRALVAFLAFKGKDFQQINALGAQYAQSVIPMYLRDHAMDKIRWHQNNGDEVVVVSASLDMYLRHWCEKHNLVLICTDLEVKQEKLTGHFVAGDCSSEAKAKKISTRFVLTGYDKIYAYGDTEEDLAMLALADEGYMNWKVV
jgi:HAD superfamily hydrolase (TIGR01490 family)